MKRLFKKKKIKPFKDLPKGQKCFVCIFLALILFFGGLTSYAFYYRSRVLPNTTIAGIKVGGLTKSEMEKKISNAKISFLDRGIKIQSQEKSWDVKLSEYGTDVIYLEAIEKAYKYGREGGVTTNFVDLLAAPITKQNFDVDITTFSEAGQTAFQKNILGEIEKPYQETSLNLVPGKVTVKAGQEGLELNLAKYEQDLYSLFKKGGDVISLDLKTKAPLITDEEAQEARAQAESILSKDWKFVSGDKNVVISSREVAKWIKVTALDSGTGLALSLDDTLIVKKLADFASTVDKKAVNARVKVDNGNLVIEKAGTDGVLLDQSKSLQALKGEILGLVSGKMDYLVSVDSTVVQPEVSAATLSTLGLKELIGTGTTDFTGSSTNRKFNIDLGQKSLNGNLVKPGDVFSTTTLLGPVDAASGYASELVIKNNRTVPDYGGGLCQVSTTLFRAVLNAGLPITERTNHSYRVGYYERGVGPGLDATVYIPNPDFKWKNDTGHAVLVQSFVKGNTVTFEIYGTKDGRVSSISAPKILEETPAGAAIYTETDTLYKDEKKQIETSHAGAKTEVTYVVTRDGKEINKQVFKSTYKPWPAQYLVGTKERPATTETAAPGA